MGKITCTKNVTKRFRCTEEQANRIQMTADIYCDGNLSEWILYAALNCHRKKKGSPKRALKPKPQPK